MRQRSRAPSGSGGDVHIATASHISPPDPTSFASNPACAPGSVIGSRDFIARNSSTSNICSSVNPRRSPSRRLPSLSARNTGEFDSSCKTRFSHSCHAESRFVRANERTTCANRPLVVCNQCSCVQMKSVSVSAVRHRSQ